MAIPIFSWLKKRNPTWNTGSGISPVTDTCGERRGVNWSWGRHRGSQIIAHKNCPEKLKMLRNTERNEHYEQQYTCMSSTPSRCTFFLGKKRKPRSLFLRFISGSLIQAKMQMYYIKHLILLITYNSIHVCVHNINFAQKIHIKFILAFYLYISPSMKTHIAFCFRQFKLLFSKTL